MWGGASRKKVNTKIIFREEGVRTLWRGATPTMGR